AEAKVSDFKGSKVHLYYPPGPLAENSQGVETADSLLSTEVDGGGNFTLEPLPVGSFVMLIRLPEQEIIIGEFSVSQESNVLVKGNLSVVRREIGGQMLLLYSLI